MEEYASVDPAELLFVCNDCGTVFPSSRRSDHVRFHARLAHTARQADSADAWNRPIG